MNSAEVTKKMLTTNDTEPPPLFIGPYHIVGQPGENVRAISDEESAHQNQAFSSSVSFLFSYGLSAISCSNLRTSRI